MEENRNMTDPFMIEPYINGQKSPATSTARVFRKEGQKFHVCENTEKYEEIVKQIDPAAERLHATRIRVILETLGAIRTEYIETTTSMLIDYYRGTGILENSAVRIYNHFEFCLISDDSFMYDIAALARAVSYGRRVTLGIDPSKDLTLTLNALELLYPIIQEGRMNLIIISGLRPVADFKIRQPMPTFVVFRESDYISAIESLPSVLAEGDYKNCLFLVQESQIKVVKELLDQLGPKRMALIEPWKPMIKKYRHELVNYDLDTILDNNQDESVVDSNKINLLSFRDKFDVVKLLNHCPTLPFVSIWNKNLEVSSYLAKNITTTSLFWYNSVLKYSPSIPHFAYIDSTSVAKTYCYNFRETLNLKTEELEDIRVVSSFLKKKVVDRDLLQGSSLVAQILRKLQEQVFPGQMAVIEYLNDFNRRLVTRHKTPEGTFVTKRSPVGFVLLEIDDETANDNDLIERLNLLVSCMLSGNVLYLSVKPGPENTAVIEGYSKFMTHYKYFVEMFTTDRSGDLLDKRLKSFIYHEGKHIGSYIKSSELKVSGAFHQLDGLLFNSRTVFKPKPVSNNTI